VLNVAARAVEDDLAGVLDQLAKAIDQS
jgi:predicted transcriptional regulator